MLPLVIKQAFAFARNASQTPAPTAETFRNPSSGPRLRLLHVRRKFDPDMEHRVSLRIIPPSDDPDGSRPVRLGDLLVVGEVNP